MGHLPGPVREWIASYVTGFGLERLQSAADALSNSYREGGTTAMAGLRPDELTAAYLAVRFPATFAAASHVLLELRRRIPTPIASILDLGAGSGAATLAAHSVFEKIKRSTLIESNPRLAAAGQELIPDSQWLVTRMEQAPISAADLVIASYALGELNPTARDRVIAAAWQAARVALVVIEPGSPPGFGTVREIRDRLLAAGAHMAAPCSSPSPCPMPADDWCHFGARLERSALHRKLKDGALSYEDEKFSYVALTKEPAKPASARVIRRPDQAPGRIRVTLCERNRLHHIVATKRDKPLFRAARKTEWGQEWRISSGKDQAESERD